MASATRPVSYVHSRVQCDICHEHQARHYCDHDECKEHMYICDNCLFFHNKYKENHCDCLQRVLVSVVDSYCYKPGHSDRHASHLCVSCKKPVCDDCRDSHHDKGHPFTEIQSAVAALKNKLSDSLDELKDEVRRQNQNWCESASDIEKLIDHKFEELSLDVKTSTENTVKLVEDHGRRMQDQLKDIKQQMLKKAQSSIVPLHHDQTAASSEVIFEAQNIIDCKDARNILSKGNMTLQCTAKEVENTKINELLYRSHFRSRISRMRMIPEETAYDLGQVRCKWEQVCSCPFSDVSTQSFLAPLPGGGYVMVASYPAPQPNTSIEDFVAANSRELVERGPNDTKLSFFTGTGELTQVKDIGMLMENEKVRGIAVLTCGKIAVLGLYIQMYTLDLKPCGVIRPKPSTGRHWGSIGVGPSGSLLAGDCVNNCIDVLSADGLILRSIRCPGVVPWQLHACPSGKFVISQVGIHAAEAMIKILKEDGSVVLSLSDESWDNVYCSADSFGNLYIAYVVVENKVASVAVNARLNIVRYTPEGKRQETILENEIIEKCMPLSIAAHKDGTQIALCSTERLFIFE